MPAAAAVSAGCRPSLQERLRQKIRAKEAARHPHKLEDHAFRAFLTAAGVKPGKKKQQKQQQQQQLEVMMVPRMPIFYIPIDAHCFQVKQETAAEVGDAMLANANKSQPGEPLDGGAATKENVDGSSENHLALQDDGPCLNPSTILEPDVATAEAEDAEAQGKQEVRLLCTDHPPSNEEHPSAECVTPVTEQETSVVNIEKEESDEEDADCPPPRSESEQLSKQILVEACEDGVSQESVQGSSEDECPQIVEIPENSVFEDVDKIKAKSFPGLEVLSVILEDVLSEDRESLNSTSPRGCIDVHQGKASRTRARRKQGRSKANFCSGSVSNHLPETPSNRKPTHPDNRADYARQKNRPSFHLDPKKMLHGRGSITTAEAVHEQKLMMTENRDKEYVPALNHKLPNRSRSLDTLPVKSSTSSESHLLDCCVRRRQKQSTTLVLCADDFVQSDGNPLINIFFRFDERPCENCSCTGQQKQASSKSRGRNRANMARQFSV